MERSRNWFCRADDLGLGQETADFLVPLVELLELAPDRILHGRKL